MAVQWNITLDDTSPLFTFSPYADGVGPNNGWQTWYTGSGYNTQAGETSHGDSFHLTSLAGASFSLSFYGTGISLYGRANCSYDILLDKQPIPTTSFAVAQGVLFARGGLPAQKHTIMLTARPNAPEQQIAFDQAIVTSVAPGIHPPVNVAYSNQNTTAIQYAGDWSTISSSEIPTRGRPTPYRETDRQGASASMQFVGRAVSVHGPLSSGHGEYSITLDGTSVVLNGSASWLIPDTLLFYQDGLDENKTHSLNITNLSAGSKFALTSVSVYDNVNRAASSTTSHNPQSKVAIIVGPVIAVTALISVVVFMTWGWRRRAALSNHRPESSVFSLGPRQPPVDEEIVVSPYVANILDAHTRETQYSLEPSRYSSYDDDKKDDRASITAEGDGDVYWPMDGSTSPGLQIPTPAALSPTAGVHMYMERTLARTLPTSAIHSAGGSSPGTPLRERHASQPSQEDMDRIMEMIAQSIDRPREDDTDSHFREYPPPRYPQ